jgi:Fungal hydrophobin
MELESRWSKGIKQHAIHKYKMSPSLIAFSSFVSLPTTAMKSSTVLSFFLPVIASALPQGPLGGLTAGLTGTVGGLTANAGIGAGLAGSGSSGSSYNAGSGSATLGSGYNAPSSGYNATSSSSSGSGAGGSVGGLPLVGGLLIGGGPSKGAWSSCAGTTGNAQCCATDVLGVADLDCLSRKSKCQRNWRFRRF